MIKREDRPCMVLRKPEGVSAPSIGHAYSPVLEILYLLTSTFNFGEKKISERKSASDRYQPKADIQDFFLVCLFVLFRQKR